MTRATIAIVALLCFASSPVGATEATADNAQLPVPAKPADADMLPPSLVHQRQQAERIVAETKQWLLSDESRTRAYDDDLILIAEAFAPALIGAQQLTRPENWQRPAILLTVEGVDHPLVRLGYARAMDLADGRVSAREPYAEAVRGLIERNAPPRLVLAAASHAAAWEDRFRAPDRSRPFHVQRSDAYLRLVEQEAVVGPGRPAATLLALDAVTATGARLMESLPVDVAGDVVTRLEAVPGVDACLRETVRGAFEKRIAWDERGGGFANTVDRNQWQRFGERLEKASSHLGKAWTLDPRRPTAPTALIGVAMAGGTPPGENEETWFNRAIVAQVDHWEAYAAMLWALRPRWGGSHEAMEAFGRRALDGGRFDTVAPFAYLEALRGILEDGGGLSWLALPGVRGRIEALAKGYEEAGTTVWRSQTQTWRVLAAVATDAFDDAAAIISDPTFAYDGVILRDARIVPTDLFHEIMAMSGPTGPAVRAADDLLANGKPTEAAAAYGAILAKLEVDEAPLDRCAALRDRIATATLAAGWASDDWTEVAFEPGLPGWRQHIGTWKVQSPRTVHGGGGERPLALACTVEPGPRFEVRANVSTGGAATSRAEVSILVNFVDEPGLYNFRCVSWYPARDRIEVTANQSDGDPLLIPLPSDGKKKKPTSLPLHVQVWDGEFTLSLGDTLLYAGPLPGSDQPLGEGLALGTHFDPPGATTVRFRDVAIRRLRERPAALTAAAAGGPK